MTKVTYLFGAGASANALPVVEKLSERLIGLSTEIRDTEELWLSNGPFTMIPHGKPQRTYQEDFLKDLEWLDKSSKGTSVDSFAKDLEFRVNELKRLKISLSMFFVFEQARNPVDIRYDQFINSILNKNLLQFPESVKILSWNYDYQFEKAYSKYCRLHDLIEIQKKINVVSKFVQNETYTGFSIYKLNGTTAFTEIDNFKDINPYTNITITYPNIIVMHNLINYYAHIINPENNCFPHLSFAWERENNTQESVINKAITATQDTDVLVVIGYSFPFFNREVDRKIIGAMKNLSKVYFQAPDAENIKTRFQAVRSKDPEGKLPYPELVAFTDVGSFLLPDEL